MFIGRFALGFAAKRAGPTATRSKDLPGRWCFGVLAPSVRRLLGEHGRRAALNRGDLDWVARRRSLILALSWWADRHRVSYAQTE